MKRGLRTSSARVAALLLLAACSHQPTPPDWQSNARLFTDRAAQAYLQGDSGLESLDFEQARAQIASTGRIDLLARLELMRCATRVASLVVGPCEGFERFRPQAGAAERAYADYLAARVQAKDVDLLPQEQRPVAEAIVRGASAAGALGKISPPLSSLVAAGVLFQSGGAEPAVIASAIETASAQGWRRPLLAWLNVQLARAQEAGDTGEVGRLQQRIDLVQGTR